MNTTPGEKHHPLHDQNLLPFYEHMRQTHAALRAHSLRNKVCSRLLAAVACLLGGILVWSSQARKSLVYVVLTYATIALAVLYCPPGKRTSTLEHKYVLVMNAVLEQFYLRINPDSLAPELPPVG